MTQFLQNHVSSKMQVLKLRFVLTCLTINNTITIMIDADESINVFVEQIHFNLALIDSYKTHTMCMY